MPVAPDVLAALGKIRHLHTEQEFEAIVSRFDPDLNAPEPPPEPTPLAESMSAEYHSCDGGSFMPHPNGVVFYRLESNGDILVILPAMKKVSQDLGAPVTLVTYKKYVPLVKGIPWLNVVGVSGMNREQAKTVLGPIGEIRDLEPDHTQKSWALAAFARTGVDAHLYDVLPLIIENRDFAAEAKVMDRHRRSHRLPLILINTYGRSSPFNGGDYLRGKLGQKYGEDFEIIDLAFVRAPRIIDLLGLYESACCIITTDTGTLHLAYATKTPTVALVRDKEGPDSWGASEPRSHWIARVPYSTVATTSGIEQITSAIDGLFHLPEKL